MKNFSSKYFDQVIEVLFLALVFLAPVIFDRRLGIVFSLTKATFIYVFILIILGVWASKLLVCGSHKFVKLPTNWLVLSYLLACTIATLTSVHVYTSLVGFYGRYEGLLTLYAYGLFFFIASNYIFDLQRLKRVIAIIACAGTLMAVYSIIQRHMLDPYAWGGVVTYERVIATIGQPNFLAAYIVMAFLLVLGFLFHEKEEVAVEPPHKNKSAAPKTNKVDWVEQAAIVLYYLIAQLTFLIMIYKLNARETLDTVLWYVGFTIILVAALFFAYTFEKLKGALLNVVLFVATVLIYVSLLYTQSRGGYMGFFFGLFLFFILVDKEVLFRNWKKILALFFLIGSITFAVFVFAKASPLERFVAEVKFKKPVASVVDSSVAKKEKKLMLTGAAGSRTETWKSAFRIIADYPLFGIGPEVLKMVFPRYESWLFRFKEAFHVKQDRCHNSIFDQAVTRGLVSFAIYVSLIATVFVLGIRALKAFSLEKRLFMAALLAAISSYIVQNQFSFGVVAIGSLFWIMLGVVSRFAVSYGEDQQEKAWNFEQVPWIPVALVVVGVAVLSYFAFIPFQADIYFKTGKSYLELRRYAEAVKELEQSLAIFPYEGGANTHYGISYLNFIRGNQITEDLFEKVRLIFTRAMHVDPYNADNLYILGKFYLMAVPFKGPAAVDAAIAYSNKALQIDPYYAEVYLTLAYAAGMQGRKKDAAAHFVKAFEINPNLGEALQGAVQAYNSYPGGVEEGVEVFQKVLEKYPEGELSYFRNMILVPLADLYLLKGEAAPAEKLFVEILQADPQNIRAQVSLAEIYLKEGKIPAALDILNEAVIVDPKNVAAHTVLGKYYLKIGDRARAKQEFEQVLQVDPNNAFAKESLSKL